MKWGTKVKTTELAIEKNIFSKHRRGICLGHDHFCIIVVCNEQMTPSKYHPKFWVESK